MGRPTVYVDLKCDRCGAPYSIRRDSYYHRKEKGRPNLCNVCRKDKHSQDIINWHSNLSQEERDARYENISNKWKENWNSKTDEEKAKALEALNEGKEKYYANLTEEEKNKRNEERRIVSQNMWANRSEEEKERIVNAMHEGKKEYYDSLSQEEKDAKIEKLCNGFRNWRDNMTDEEKAKESEERRARWYAMSDEKRERSLKIMQEEWRKWYNSSSEEERKVRIDHMTEGLREWYSSLDEEGRKRHKESCMEYWNNLTPDGFLEWVKKQQDGISEYINKIGIPQNVLELEFRNTLHVLGIPHKWQYHSEIIDPGFNNAFPKNPITGGKVSPFHNWDFLLETKQGNVLIDIDGWIHHIGPGRYISSRGVDEGAIVKFNDAQRPYQTDGMEAYVISANYDKLDDNAKVFQVDAEKKKLKTPMEYKQFLRILQFMNMSDKDKKFIISCK